MHSVDYMYAMIMAMHLYEIHGPMS